MEIKGADIIKLVEDICDLKSRVCQLEKRAVVKTSRPGVVTKSPKDEAVTLFENQEKMRGHAKVEHSYPSDQKKRHSELEAKHGDLNR